MIEISFEEELLPMDGKLLSAGCAGTFTADKDGAIETINLDVYERNPETGCYRRSGQHPITGEWFVLLRQHLQIACEDQINAALQDLRDSAAASKADRRNDALWAA